MAYEPNTALEFFRLFGTTEFTKQDTVVLVQGQKANRLLLQHDKMYLLVKGKVSIQVASKEVASVKPGEIFGELTPLIQSVRSASAVTQMPCKLISLNEKQFVAGLKQKPEFALMLMSVLVKNLRQAVTETEVSLLAEDKNSKKGYVLSKKTLRELVRSLADTSITHVLAKHTIFQQGGVGMLMYVIVEGQVIAKVDDKVVGRSGPGGIIGEVALVDQKRRMASVIAETNCSLLAINRQTFLELVQTQPAFGLALLRTLASRLYSCRTGHSYTAPHSLFNGF